MTAVRTVLLGDSHLARLRRALAGLPGEVHNAAVGGASSRELPGQVAGMGDPDAVVLSVGTNDAAPWKRVPLDEFVRLLSACLAAHRSKRCVYVAPPGVVEDRLTGARDRTNAVIDDYRRAAMAACEDAGVQVVRADLLLAPMGPRAFASDGLHLNASGYRVLVPAIASAVAGRAG